MKTAILSDHAGLLRGITFKPADKCDYRNDDAIACMRTKNIQNLLDETDLIGIPRKLVKSEEKMLRAGDILVSSANSWNLVGKCCWVGKLSYGATAGGFISILRPKSNELDNRYLYHWFSSPLTQHKVRSFGNQTTNISNLNHKLCMKLEIPLPPLPEQKRIAAILDAADALRSKRRQAIAELDALLQSTFLDMFGDPVENPKGWEKCELGDHIEVLTDYHANGSYKILKKHVELQKQKDYALMIRTTDLEKEDYGSNENIYISESAYHFLKKSKVFGGEIIINKIGSAGKIYLMPHLNRPVSLAMNSFLIRMNPSISHVFLYYFLTSKYGASQIEQRVKGAVTKTIKKEAIRSIPILLPPEKKQLELTTIVESIETQKAQQQAHLTELDQLFGSLQQRAFNGEL